jgi:hypothetical protein
MYGTLKLQKRFKVQTHKCVDESHVGFLPLNLTFGCQGLLVQFIVVFQKELGVKNIQNVFVLTMCNSWVRCWN